MRKNAIGQAVLDILHAENYSEAFELFRTECDYFKHCDYSHLTNNCVVLCLLPKLLHESLGATDAKLEKRINTIRDDLKTAVRVSPLVVKNSDINA